MRIHDPAKRVRFSGMQHPNAGIIAVSAHIRVTNERRIDPAFVVSANGGFRLRLARRCGHRKSVFPRAFVDGHPTGVDGFPRPRIAACAPRRRRLGRRSSMSHRRIAPKPHRRREVRVANGECRCPAQSGPRRQTRRRDVRPRSAASRQRRRSTAPCGLAATLPLDTAGHLDIDFHA
jgi:hypothetical protein